MIMVWLKQTVEGLLVFLIIPRILVYISWRGTVVNRLWVGVDMTFIILLEIVGLKLIVEPSLVFPRVLVLVIVLVCRTIVNIPRVFVINRRTEVSWCFVAWKSGIFQGRIWVKHVLEALRVFFEGVWGYKQRRISVLFQVIVQGFYPILSALLWRITRSRRY